MDRRMTGACDRCLRRSFLIGRLAPQIARLLHRSRPTGGVLGLAEEELLRVVPPHRSADAREQLARFSPGRLREEAVAAGASTLCCHDDAYPAQLRDLTDPPAVLYARGKLGMATLAGDPSVALVGTRRASPYGLELAGALGRGLGAAGVAVVSGLALGIDAAAHRGCLDGGGAALAVLACGVDVAYPRANRRLLERVADSGLVLSEMPPGTTPFRWAFPARNRLMAALARMTVVIEAAEPSGSLITAQFAQDLGREVGAVPGRVTSRTAAGTNALLGDGARVVLGAQDVLDELFGVGVREAALRPAAPSPIDPELRPVLDAVEGGAGIERLSEATGLEARQVRIALARLEADGHLLRDRLGGYERAVPE
jgi:DNA processing protein